MWRPFVLCQLFLAITEDEARKCSGIIQNLVVQIEEKTWKKQSGSLVREGDYNNQLLEEGSERGKVKICREHVWCWL